MKHNHVLDPEALGSYVYVARDVNDTHALVSTGYQTAHPQIMTPRALRAFAALLEGVANEIDGGLGARMSARAPQPAPKVTGQNAVVLDHLRRKDSLSNVEAQAVYRIRSLPRRIADLKANGYDIRTALHVDPTGQRYARYSLVA